MTIQVMGKNGICSSVGDIKKHEKFKKLPMKQRIEKLQEVYDTYGALSEEFFIQVKPFIMWTIYRCMRGMHYSSLEDLVNTSYEELVIAFQGGDTSYYNKAVYKEPIYGTDYYYSKYNNIGTFVMAIVGSAVAKYRSRNFKKQVTHIDQEHDISDKLNFTDFELNNNLDYTMADPNDVVYFKTFKPNLALQQHIRCLQETHPRNNVLYNYLLWKEKD